MPAPPELRLHIKRLVLDRAALGADGIFDTAALQAELVQRLSNAAAVFAPPRAPLVQQLGGAIAGRVSPHLQAHTPTLRRP